MKSLWEPASLIHNGKLSKKSLIRKKDRANINFGSPTLFLIFYYFYKSVSSPSRASLMTGQNAAYPVDFGGNTVLPRLD